MGFDRPLAVQFGDFVRRAVVGDFGKSLQYRTSAWSLIMERLPATLELAAAAMLLRHPGGGAPRHPGGDPARLASGTRCAQGVALLGQALPAYWVGLILILVLSVQLNLLPVAGRSGWSSLVMPMVTLGMGTLGRLTQLARSVMLDALGQDYIRTAWAKGLAPRRRPVPPRAQERGHPPHHADRRQLRVHAGRCGPDRERLLVSRASAGSPPRRSSSATSRWCRPSPSSRPWSSSS